MITIGEKIYYTGDAANIEGIFEVVDVIKKNYTEYVLQEIDLTAEEKPRKFNIYPSQLGNNYPGAPGQRFSTLKSYSKYRQTHLKELYGEINAQ